MIRLRNFVYYPVSVDADYYAGLYANGGGANVTLRLMVRYLSSGFTFLEGHYTDFSVNTTSFSMYGFSSTPPPEAAYVNFGFRISNAGTSSCTVYIDDCWLKEVKYPVLTKKLGWSNTYGDYDFLNPGNYFRIYRILVNNSGTSSGTIVRIYKHLSSTDIVAGLNVPSGSVVEMNYNPSVRSFFADRSRIESTTATGGTVTAIVWYNGCNNRGLTDI